MTTDTHMVSGDYSVQADGIITLLSLGSGMTLSAGGTGLNGGLLLDAANSIALNCGAASVGLVNNDPLQGIVSIAAGAAGTIGLIAGPTPAPSAIQLSPELVKIRTGPTAAGVVIELLPELLSISVGEPGAGSSIKITPESITFKVAEVTFTMTPEGITEDVAEVTREVTAEGHNLTAAETEFNVGVEGFASEGPVKTHETEGAEAENDTIATDATDAVKTEAAGVAMDVPG